jgi:hypothetical protein
MRLHHICLVGAILVLICPGISASADPNGETILPNTEIAIPLPVQLSSNLAHAEWQKFAIGEPARARAMAARYATGSPLALSRVRALSTWMRLESGVALAKPIPVRQVPALSEALPVKSGSRTTIEKGTAGLTDIEWEKLQSLRIREGR